MFGKCLCDGVSAYFDYPRAFGNYAERAVNVGLKTVVANSGLATPAEGWRAARAEIATDTVVVGDTSQ